MNVSRTQLGSLALASLKGRQHGPGGLRGLPIPFIKATLASLHVSGIYSHHPCPFSRNGGVFGSVVISVSDPLERKSEFVAKLLFALVLEGTLEDF